MTHFFYKIERNLVNELALFCGAGGGLLGTRLLGWQPVCGVENDPYCREIILRRQEEGHLEPFPVWDDVRTFDGKPWRGVVDCITAGFPCQPFSVAGNQDGDDDERNMWPETIRIIREVGPRFCLLENVPGLVRFDYFGQILGDLADAGFDAEWGIVSADSVGALHHRDRVWICAHSCGVRLQGCGKTEKEPWSREQFEGLVQAELRVSVPAGSSGGVAHGVANRMDRLKAIGNGQVPAVVRAAWKLLSGEA
jgi:DNA (cytosine-5)-methyltransferase 1